MKVYKFVSQVSHTCQVTIPEPLANTLPPGTVVRIMLLVDDPDLPVSDGPTAETLFLPPLHDLIAEIKRTPTQPQTIRPGSGLLAVHLANPVTEADPDLDVAVWNQTWDQIETQFKADELAHEESELETLLP